MINFFHQLFNPHCIHCHDEAEEAKICHNCEYLKIQISRLQEERDRLLDKLIEPTESVQANRVDESPINLNTSRFVPFSVKRQELESLDRQKARSMAEDLKRNYNKNIESLEKEILEARVDPLEISKLSDLPLEDLEMKVAGQNVE